MSCDALEWDAACLNSLRGVRSVLFMKSKFIGSRAVDPSVEDSLAYIKLYRPMTNFANP